MGVIITKKGKAPVRLSAETLCRPEAWPFPGDKHILNPQTRTCVRCGKQLPDDFVGYRVDFDAAKKSLAKAAGL